ncbi:MAG: glycosyltransferase family 39 protein [Anaerolineales bacterium]
MPALRKTIATVSAVKTFPALLLILVNILIGLFIFEHYGFSYDEPLFYGYADAIGYAYTPANWFGEDFDLTLAYGPSPGDHGNRGPAYLLLARFPAHLLQAMGLPQDAAWHLVNFLVFQIALYYFFVICLRWMGRWAAFSATAFMATQPILWGHAFINPKDPPFLLLFLLSLELGFRMADRLAHPSPGTTKPQTLKHVLVPAIVLGLATNVRVLAPLAAVLVGIYFLLLGKNAKRIVWFIPYGMIAYAVVVITWPYLWENPIGKFIEAVTFFSYNPTQLRVYFYGQYFRANALPLRYLPATMLFTLTEPVFFLASLGGLTALWRALKNNIQWKTLLPTLGWFVVPFMYVLIKRPPMYDGFRHFLFIVPPIFILAGIALDALFKFLRTTWLRFAIIAALVLPGLIPIVKLHPYEYTYYNQFVGGTSQAAARFETDYWLTCYKEAMQEFNRHFAHENPTLYVKREPYIARYYADPRITVRDFVEEGHFIQDDDYRLLSARLNPGLQRYRDPALWGIKVSRNNTIFCVIQKQ